jgi:hypothetical protein
MDNRVQENKTKLGLYVSLYVAINRMLELNIKIKKE